MSISDYGKIIEQRTHDEQHMTEGKVQNYETFQEGKQRQMRTLGKFYE